MAAPQNRLGTNEDAKLALLNIAMMILIFLIVDSLMLANHVKVGIWPIIICLAASAIIALISICRFHRRYYRPRP